MRAVRHSCRAGWQRVSREVYCKKHDATYVWPGQRVYPQTEGRPDVRVAGVDVFLPVHSLGSVSFCAQDWIRIPGRSACLADNSRLPEMPLTSVDHQADLQALLFESSYQLKHA